MLANVQTIPAYLLRPVYLLRSYPLPSLRSDLIAGVTVGAVLLPQGIAFALLAGLPSEMGLYSAIVAAVVAALWGSSNHLHTGPTNAASILVLSTLLPLAEPGTPRYIVGAGLLAFLSGVFRMSLGLARLGMLVNFVSISVIIGFTAGAGALILVSQLKPLLRLEFRSSPGFFDTLQQVVLHLSSTHLLSLAIGLGTMALVILVPRRAPRLPASLVALVAATATVGLLRLDRQGVQIIGRLHGSLPPLTLPPLFDFSLAGPLATGALAIAAIGLVEATAIARSIASQSGQRLDNNQEFVGQGLANLACGLLSGFPCSGSFNRSALSYKADGRTPLASVFSGLFVLLGMFVLGPLAAFLPTAALAGVLIVAAYGMIDRTEMVRIWYGARGDAAIMAVTLVASLLFPLQFAVLAGIMLSLAYYILKTSTPQVLPVVPDEDFRHLRHQPNKPACPQLGIFNIHGDLYFGAVGHIEQTIHRHSVMHPRQRYVLLRMHGVHHCDISGIHVLENIVRSYRERGGDVFMVRVHAPVLQLMKSTHFYTFLGEDHFLDEDGAIEYLFYKVLDPAICIYESDVRIFRECQNLPRPDYAIDIPLHTDMPATKVPSVTPQLLWHELRSTSPPLVIDVREPREFKRGHIPQAQLLPLSKLLAEPPAFPTLRTIVFVCQSGRRSTRAAALLRSKGHKNAIMLRGGMVAWENARLLEATGDPRPEEVQDEARPIP